MINIILNEEQLGVGREMHGWLTDLMPICRSLTGPGVRETLRYLQALIPGLAVHAVPSGTQAFDWTVPDEWSLHEAYIIGPDGSRVVDSAWSNLHVMGYSEPFEGELDLADLQPHLYSLPAQPDAIPYITSYYKRRWGFCLTDRQRQALAPGRYRVVIRATLEPGVLNYGEVVIPGDTPDEILLSTYICHPSMANNELSGPVLATALARWLAGLPRRRYTYRIIFSAETIGAIVYISRHLESLKRAVRGGFILTCVGDERAVSYLSSRLGGTLSDRIAEHVLSRHAAGFDRYSFLERGSDERQYCSPGVDLPICSVMRSKYGTYPEYHTSLDDARLVTPRGLAGSFALYTRMLTAMEGNRRWKTTCLCEPQLSKRGLYPTTSTKDIRQQVGLQMNMLAYCDGMHDLVAVAERIGCDVADCLPIVQKLVDAGVLVEVV